LTKPILRLRGVAQQLARGNLQARVGADFLRRQDELADLGRDFDLMAEQLESLFTAQRRLLGDVSHELRSPLARLSVALELARRQCGDAALPSLDRIERETERLNELIGQLLALSRLESGPQPTAGERVDLAALVREIAADAAFEARARQRSVAIMELAECATTGSAELLRRAIENVVRNALCYTREGTAVELTLRREADTARLSVRDHGEGVPEAALAQLFQPFYRVAEARDRQTGGIGLGLAIAERAVRLHGGQVTAANAVDGGLFVELRLPVR
jgi:two-component system sensor histidine kinase CpxA